ncbi:hypothetical protein O5269_28370, partial [Escherichia coli]|nr:hypothetical protein [Escherichia coli]
FKDRYTTSAKQALKDAGLNVNAVSNFTPVNIGNNRYRLVNGSGRWATDPRTNEAIVVTTTFSVLFAIPLHNAEAELLFA